MTHTLTNNSTKIEFVKLIKSSLFYSLLYCVLTDLFLKLCKNIFFITDTDGITNMEMWFWILSPIYSALVLLLVIIITTRNYMKNENYSFSGVLKQILFIVIFTVLIGYILGLTFTYIDIILNAPVDLNQIGYLYPFESYPNPIDALFKYPYSEIKYAIINLKFFNFIFAILNSKILLSLFIIFYQGRYYLFKKINKPAYFSLIPVKNKLVLLSYTGYPIWWVILIYIPFIRILPLFYVNIVIAKRFNKTKLYAFGMTIIPLYFYGEISINKEKK